MSIVYTFSTIPLGKVGGYIFQVVKNRRLTDIDHSHDFYEILYTVRGVGVQAVNGVIRPLEQGEAMILRPGDTHYFLEQSPDAVLISFSVEVGEFLSVAGVFGNMAGQITAAEEPPLYRCQEPFALFRQYMEETVTAIDETDCKFFLCCFLKAYGDRQRVLQPMPRLLLHAVNEMKKKEHLRAGLSAFCALSHYSQSQLTRHVKRCFGMTPKQYVNELRLQSAYHDVVFTGKPLADIAEEIGFESYSHFNKIFHTRFSITPAALRRQNGMWTV